MNARILGATVIRILRQLRHDRRTLALVVVIPLVLLTLVYYLFDRQQPVVSQILLLMLGIFPLVIMFLITSIAMLRERRSGTLEHLMTTPLGKLDLLFGYGIAFGLVACGQALIACGFAYWVLDLQTAGSAVLVVCVAVLNALLGVGFGLLGSAFASTEFQAVQMFPAFILPQILLCGLFVARDQMATWLQVIANVLPLSYAAEALQEVGGHTEATATYWRDCGVVAGCILLALVLAAATLRRRTP